ncbi:MAG: formyltransferase family protein [Allopontixanthobacter sediminis]
MKCILVGAVGSTELALETIARSPEWSVELVVTLPLDAAGRHSDFVDIEPLARRAGADVLRTTNINDAESLARISETEATFVFVIGWSQLCGEAFMALKPGSIIGYHPAPLPRLRGRAPLAWTILLEEPITAGTLFWLGSGADDGDLIDQQFFHVARDETARTLYARHQAALEVLLHRTLAVLASGDRPRIRQDERYATWAAKRIPDDGLIDWRDPAEAIDRLVRAVGRPYPGAFTWAGEEKLTIWRSRLAAGDDQYHAGPGQVIWRDDQAFAVKTGSGVLQIDEWECASGRMPRMHSWLGRAPR